MNPLLIVKNLCVNFSTLRGQITAVKNLNFSLEKGRTLGIVGESGSGKSQSVFAIMHLLAKNARVSGEILFRGENILQMPQKTFADMSFKEISIVFQDPMTSLNPYTKIGAQLREVLLRHEKISHDEANFRCVQMLQILKIPEAKKRMNVFPHELSGGMRQRVMIAMALLCRPKLLICDEPTTALDVTIQAQILKLLRELQREMGMAMILISHDLGVIASACDEVLVMYAGQAMERGEISNIFSTPTHPYTRALLATMPSVTHSSESLKIIPGNPPDLLALPPGCSFAPRCEMATDACVATPKIYDFSLNGVPHERRCLAPIEVFKAAPDPENGEKNAP